MLHAAAGQGHFPAGGDRLVDDLLHAVDVRGERRDDDPAVPGRLEETVEAVADGRLTGRIAGLDGVRGVREVTQDPFLAEFREPGEVDHAAVDRGGVDLEVARMDDGADLGGQREGQRVGDGVVDVDGLDLELAEGDGVPRLDLVEICGLEEAVLFEFAFDEADRERRAVDRLVDEFQKVREAADVVLVAVRDDDALDAVLVALHIGEVRDDDVDAEHLRLREREAAVEDDHVPVIFEEGHVLSDLVQAAEERDLQRDLERIVFPGAFAPFSVSGIVVFFVVSHKSSFFRVFAIY